MCMIISICYSSLFVPSSSHPLTSHPSPLTLHTTANQNDAIMLLLQPLHSSLPSTPSPSIPSLPYVSSPPPLTLHPSTSIPSPLIPQPMRRHPQNLPHITFYQPPSSPRKSSGGGGGEEGGSVGEESKRESLASPTSTGRGSVEEESPAESYEYRGTGS